MSRKGIAEKIGADLREELNQLIDDGAYTIDDLVDWLAERSPGEAPSRSAIGRYVRKRRAKAAALETLAQVAAVPDEGGSDEALDLMMDLAALRIKETKILDRLRELGVV